MMDFPLSLSIYRDSNSQIVTTAKLGTRTLQGITSLTYQQHIDLVEDSLYLLIRHPFERYVSGLITHRHFSMLNALLGPQEDSRFSDRVLYDQLTNLLILENTDYWNYFIEKYVVHNFGNFVGLNDVHTSNWLVQLDTAIDFKVVHLKQLDNLITHLGHLPIEKRNVSNQKITDAVTTAILDNRHFKETLLRYLKPEINVYRTLKNKMEFNWKYPKDIIDI